MNETAYRGLARSLLKRASNFAHCADSTIETMVSEGVLEQVPRGEWVCRSNEPFDKLCLILEGVLESSVTLDGQHRHLVAYLPVGDLLGTVCCVDRKPMPHDVRVHTNAILLQMPLPLIMRLRGVDVGVIRAFEAHLASRARMFYERLTDALVLPAETRVARMLLELAGQFGVLRSGRTTIVLRVPQTDLADLLGISRQRINQTLNQFERQSVLTLRRSTIDSIDLARLTVIAWQHSKNSADAVRPA